jgi:hypothetical protein
LVENYLPQAGAEQFLLRQARRERELVDRTSAGRDEAKETAPPEETPDKDGPLPGPDDS